MGFPARTNAKRAPELLPELLPEPELLRDRSPRLRINRPRWTCSACARRSRRGRTTRSSSRYCRDVLGGMRKVRATLRATLLRAVCLFDQIRAAAFVTHRHSSHVFGQSSARALSLLRLAGLASRSPRAISARRPAPSSRRWSRRPPCRAERGRGGARLDFRETRIGRTGRRNSVFASPLSLLGTQIRGTPRDLIRVRERAGGGWRRGGSRNVRP